MGSFLRLNFGLSSFIPPLAPREQGEGQILQMRINFATSSNAHTSKWIRLERLWGNGGCNRAFNCWTRMNLAQETEDIRGEVWEFFGLGRRNPPESVSLRPLSFIIHACYGCLPGLRAKWCSTGKLIAHKPLQLAPVLNQSMSPFLPSHVSSSLAILNRTKQDTGRGTGEELSVEKRPVSG